MTDLLLDRLNWLHSEYTALWCRWGGSPPAHFAREMADIATEIATLADEIAEIHRKAANALVATPGFATEEVVQ